jgi:hypothetical protein
MELGSKLYYRLTDDDDIIFNIQAEQIFGALVKMLPQVNPAVLPTDSDQLIHSGAESNLATYCRLSKPLK